MKILCITPYLPSLIRVRPYQLIRQLSGEHDVTLLTVGDTTDDPSELSQALGCRQVEIVPITLSDRLRSCAQAVAQGRPLQAAVCQTAGLRARLVKLLTAQHFDVVHIEHLRAAELVASLPPGQATVFDAVDCISLLQSRTVSASRSQFQRLVAAIEVGPTRRYEAALLRRFDRTAVTSPEDCQALQALAPGSPVEVIPNGVDLDYFQRWTGPVEPATVAFSGKMSYHANCTAVLHFVERILPLLRHTHPGVRLRIVGSRPPAKIQRLGDDPGIEVTGYRADIRPAIGSATVAICPVTVKVGIQNKILEAMALGRPVVTTRAGLSGLEAQPGRDLLVADTSAQFAELVGWLLNDSEARAAIGAAGRDYVERHHRWETAARRFVTLYQAAAAHTAGQAPSTASQRRHATLGLRAKEGPLRRLVSRRKDRREE